MKGKGSVVYFNWMAKFVDQRHQSEGLANVTGINLSKSTQYKRCQTTACPTSQRCYSQKSSYLATELQLATYSISEVFLERMAHVVSALTINT